MSARHFERMARAVLMGTGLIVASAGPGRAQTADSAVGTPAAPAAATAAEAPVAPPAPPAVRRWGDSVTLRANNLSLRLPADGVRWQQRRDPESQSGVYILEGEVNGVREHLKLNFWTNPGASTCAAWVALQRGRFARYRQLGMRVPEETVLEAPAWLPQGDGWSPTVWMGNACRDGATEALVITVYGVKEDSDHRALDATRTMLWYLGAAASRQQR